MTPHDASGPTLLGVPVVFLLFGLTLVGILGFHRRALEISLSGLALVVAVRMGHVGFDLSTHLRHEWVKLANLLGLLVGFELLADHFERSHVTETLPRVLPRGALGCFSLLVIVWLLSGLLDNIAAAMIGAKAAAGLFRRQVHLGYLAAIVAAANAGGAGSVLGDTTTTMLWLEGVSPLSILPAYIGAATALLVFGVCASLQQHSRAPIVSQGTERARIDGGRLGLVATALGVMVATNLVVDVLPRARGQSLPFLALALWGVLLAAAPVRAPSWKLLPRAFKGSVFLLALVLIASLMPVDGLPTPRWQTTFGLGLVSSVFDNIPLTKLGLEQGGYDWALFAYAVGFGGSMLWFGSSAGVAIAGLFPEARSAVGWLRAAWHVPVGFVAGFFALYALRGWNP